MSPKSHFAEFQSLCFLIYPAIFISLFVLVGNESAFPFILIIIFSLPLVSQAFFNWAPISCKAPGRTGRVKRTMNRVEFWTVKNICTCKTSFTTHEEKISRPALNI